MFCPGHRPQALTSNRGQISFNAFVTSNMLLPRKGDGIINTGVVTKQNRESFHLATPVCDLLRAEQNILP